MGHNKVILKNANESVVGGKSVGYFLGITKDLNSWLPTTIPASGQGGTWTRGLWITSPTT